jgi:hypothetical protein
VPNWKPIVNPKVAEEFIKLGYVEDRDFYVSPYLPDDCVVEINEDTTGPLKCLECLGNVYRCTEHEINGR